MKIFWTKKTKLRKFYYFLGFKIGSSKNMEGIISEKIKSIEGVLDNKFSTFLDKQREKLFFNDAYDTRMLQVMCHANAISATHQKTFGKYKNCNEGKDVVLVATGPSLNNYIPIKNAIHVGVNKAIKFDKVKFDYLFFQDAAFPRNQYVKELNQYSAHKFYGLLQDTIRHDWLVSETDNIIANANRYYVISHWYYPPLHFTYDIENEPLGCGGSVAFAAMQFILWTNPKKIYLVGCDCSEGYFDNTQTDFPANHLIDGWKKLKEFASIYYPETEIISINPVGLKGVFKDIYQNPKD